MTAFDSDFFNARKAQAQTSSGRYVDVLGRWRTMCEDIQRKNKFSQQFHQNEFERSVVESCLSRLQQGRTLSFKQQDLISKMHHRKGPVLFCGHRNS